MEPTKLEITIGTDGRDYRGGDMLNAIDEVISYFLNQSPLEHKHIAELLRTYANLLEE